MKNEVNDIGLAVSQVQEFAQRCQRFQENILEAADCDVTDLLEKAQISLTPLQIVISGLAAASKKEGSKNGLFEASPLEAEAPQNRAGAEGSCINQEHPQCRPSSGKLVSLVQSLMMEF